MDSVGRVIATRDRRQQITPDMKFTCDDCMDSVGRVIAIY